MKERWCLAGWERLPGRAQAYEAVHRIVTRLCAKRALLHFACSELQGFKRASSLLLLDVLATSGLQVAIQDDRNARL